MDQLACRSTPSAAGNGFPGQSTFSLHRAEATHAVRRPEDLYIKDHEHESMGSVAERERVMCGRQAGLQRDKNTHFVPKHTLLQIPGGTAWEGLPRR